MPSKASGNAPFIAGLLSLAFYRWPFIAGLLSLAFYRWPFIAGLLSLAFYRWPFIAGLLSLAGARLQGLFPTFPDRTRLFRALAARRSWTQLFWAKPTTRRPQLWAYATATASNWCIPSEKGARPNRLAKRAKATIGGCGIVGLWDCGIVGAKLCLILNQWGLVVDFEADSANVSDQRFHPMIEKLQEEMVVLADSGFRAKQGDPANMKVCKKGTWNDRMTVETVLWMLHTVDAPHRGCSTPWMLHTVDAPHRLPP